MNKEKLKEFTVADLLTTQQALAQNIEQHEKLAREQKGDAQLIYEELSRRNILSEHYVLGGQLVLVTKPSCGFIYKIKPITPKDPNETVQP